MNFERIIELEDLTLEECYSMYLTKNYITVINDGHVVDLQKETC